MAGFLRSSLLFLFAVLLGAAGLYALIAGKYFNPPALDEAFAQTQGVFPSVLSPTVMFILLSALAILGVLLLINLMTGMVRAADRHEDKEITVSQLKMGLIFRSILLIILTGLLLTAMALLYPPISIVIGL